MAKVYVWIGSGDDAELRGVFSTPEKAREAVDGVACLPAWCHESCYLGWTESEHHLVLKAYNAGGHPLCHVETVEIATVDRKR